MTNNDNQVMRWTSGKGKEKQGEDKDQEVENVEELVMEEGKGR